MPDNSNSEQNLVEMFREAADEVLQDKHLNIYQETARDVIKIERKYFYGDANNYGRLGEIRKIIADKFKESTKE